MSPPPRCAGLPAACAGSRAGLCARARRQHLLSLPGEAQCRRRAEAGREREALSSPVSGPGALPPTVRDGRAWPQRPVPAGRAQRPPRAPAARVEVAAGGAQPGTQLRGAARRLSAAAAGSRSTRQPLLPRHNGPGRWGSQCGRAAHLQPRPRELAGARAPPLAPRAWAAPGRPLPRGLRGSAAGLGAHPPCCSRLPAGSAGPACGAQLRGGLLPRPPRGDSRAAGLLALAGPWLPRRPSAPLAGPAAGRRPGPGRRARTCLPLAQRLLQPVGPHILRVLRPAAVLPRRCHRSRARRRRVGGRRGRAAAGRGRVRAGSVVVGWAGSAAPGGPRSLWDPRLPRAAAPAPAPAQLRPARAALRLCGGPGGRGHKASAAAAVAAAEARAPRPRPAHAIRPSAAAQPSRAEPSRAEPARRSPTQRRPRVARAGQSAAPTNQRPPLPAPPPPVRQAEAGAPRLVSGRRSRGGVRAGPGEAAAGAGPASRPDLRPPPPSPRPRRGRAAAARRHVSASQDRAGGRLGWTVCDPGSRRRPCWARPPGWKGVTSPSTPSRGLRRCVARGPAVTLRARRHCRDTALLPPFSRVHEGDQHSGVKNSSKGYTAGLCAGPPRRGKPDAGPLFLAENTRTSEPGPQRRGVEEGGEGREQGASRAGQPAPS